MTVYKIMTGTRLTAAFLTTLLIFFPIYWLFVSSFKTPGELARGVPSLWPESLALDNFVEVMNTVPFVLYGMNTLLMTVGILVLQLNLAFWAAYAFAKGTFYLKDFLFLVVIAALIVPEQVIFVPVYVMMAKLGWLNTFAALIVPHAASAYGIFLLRQTFKSINNDVIEAAKVDGAGRGRIIYRLLVPLAKPTVVTLLIFKFIGSWNAYFWPLIMTNSDEMRVLTVGIAMLKDSFAGANTLNWHLVMAGSVLSILPVMAVFVLAQRHIMTAMSHSTFK